MTHSEYAYNEIRAWILSGELERGERLVEVRLAKQLNVSRTPVREALGRLIVDKLVSRSPDGSLLVHQATAREIEDIYLIREVLDGLAARLAARRGSERDLALAEQSINAMVTETDENSGGASGANIRFHGILYDAAHNERLRELGDDLRDLVQLFSREALESFDRKVVVAKEHAIIVDALRTGDPDAAETAAREHVRKAREYLVSLEIARTSGSTS